MTAAVTLVVAAGFPNRVHYINHEKVTAAMVKGERIIEDEGLIRHRLTRRNRTRVTLTAPCYSGT